MQRNISIPSTKWNFKTISSLIEFLVNEISAVGTSSARLFPSDLFPSDFPPLVLLASGLFPARNVPHRFFLAKSFSLLLFVRRYFPRIFSNKHYIKFFLKNSHCKFRLILEGKTKHEIRCVVKLLIQMATINSINKLWQEKLLVSVSQRFNIGCCRQNLPKSKFFETSARKTGTAKSDTNKRLACNPM